MALKWFVNGKGHGSANLVGSLIDYTRTQKQLFEQMIQNYTPAIQSSQTDFLKLLNVIPKRLPLKPAPPLGIAPKIWTPISRNIKTAPSSATLTNQMIPQSLSAASLSSPTPSPFIHSNELSYRQSAITQPPSPHPIDRITENRPEWLPDNLPSLPLELIDLTVSHTEVDNRETSKDDGR